MTAGAIALVMTPISMRRVLAVTGFALLTAGTPFLILPVALVTGGALVGRRLRAVTSRALTMSEDRAALAELTAIGLTGGLAIQQALEMAARSVGGSVQRETLALLRQARVSGMAVAMGGATGTSGDFYRAIGRAAATGSSLVDTVVRIADESYEDINAARLRELRRLPVTMLFPLTLLILPGFLLLTVAPALLDAFGRLEI